MTVRTHRRSVGVILLLVLGSGCGQSATRPDERDAASLPAVEAPPLAPLTGVPLEDATVTQRPVVAAKIENLAAGGPEAGLEAADLVFEGIVEGGLTRYLALFQSNVPERVGPIRSARPEDAAVVPAFDAMLFISGARPDVLQQLEKAGVVVREEDGRLLRRDPSRRSPHNVFANGNDLFAAAADSLPAAKPIGWAFSDVPPPGAVVCPSPCADDPGDSITVRMSHASLARFRYDPAAGVYYRLQGDRPSPDAGLPQVGIANVVVLGMQIGPGGCCDPAGNPLTETQVQGSGRALVLRDGRRYEATWSKPSPERHFAISLPDGAPFPFKPGPSWVLLAPASAVPKPL